MHVGGPISFKNYMWRPQTALWSVNRAGTNTDCVDNLYNSCNMIKTDWFQFASHIVIAQNCNVLLVVQTGAKTQTQAKTLTTIY